MPKNGPNGHFGPKISNLKLMRYETVISRILQFGRNLPYITVQLSVQYENFNSYHLGTMGF